MKTFLKLFHRGETGFTLMELLIVVAILGIIAGVVALNLGGFLDVGRLNAANTEAENVKTAAVAFYAEQNPPAWPASSTVLAPLYLTGTLKGTYTFDTTTGSISGATGWDRLSWDATGQKWYKP